IRNISGDIVIQLYPARRYQLKDRDGGKLFGDRSDPEDLLRINRHLEFEIGHAKAFPQKDDIVTGDQHGRARCIGRESFG
ncbi:MAG: hypothetical protein QOJ87_1365, partial [Verrucomicrobiota bacterium]